MADGSHHSHDHHVPGSMDISHHEKTWLAFWAGAKWSSIGIIIIVVILAIFRTNG